MHQRASWGHQGILSFGEVPLADALHVRPGMLPESRESCSLMPRKQRLTLQSHLFHAYGGHRQPAVLQAAPADPSSSDSQIPDAMLSCLRVATGSQHYSKLRWQAPKPSSFTFKQHDSYMHGGSQAASTAASYAGRPLKP